MPDPHAQVATQGVITFQTPMRAEWRWTNDPCLVCRVSCAESPKPVSSIRATVVSWDTMGAAMTMPDQDATRAEIEWLIMQLQACEPPPGAYPLWARTGVPRTRSSRAGEPMEVVADWIDQQKHQAVERQEWEVAAALRDIEWRIEKGVLPFAVPASGGTTEPAPEPSALAPCPMWGAAAISNHHVDYSTKSVPTPMEREPSAQGQWCCYWCNVGGMGRQEAEQHLRNKHPGATLSYHMPAMPQPTEREPESFGDARGPAWQRGETSTETIRLAEMACCGFRFDALHTNPDGGLTCPLCEPAASTECEPSEAAIEAAIVEEAAWRKEVEIGVPPGPEHIERILCAAFHAQFGPAAPSGDVEKRCRCDIARWSIP